MRERRRILTRAAPVRLAKLTVAIAVLVPLWTPVQAPLMAPGVSIAQESDGTVFAVPAGQVLRAQPPAGVITTTPTGRYPEVLEFLRAPAGDLIVVADLDVETYVAGIAEMPAHWHEEALKAQAVAARTYAWFQTRLGTFQRRGFGYDICATTSCQVYKGASVVETPLLGQRWQDAVDATAGEVLMYDGQPILARYFSTSGGQTWANEIVFPSEGPRPYLLGGPDPDDAVSPLHEWEAVFTRDQLNEILSRGQSVAAATPFATIRDIPADAPGRTEAVRVVGEDGTVVEVGAVAFRSFVSAVAPGAYPDDFPGPRSDGRSLPSTIPSSRFTIDAGPLDDVIVVHGRGWGHGVGMGQYGALGKAERGMTYDQILAAYYEGLTPVRGAGIPDRIRVGLQSTPSEVAVHFDGPTRLLVDGVALVDAAIGTWTITPSTAAGLTVSAPPGYGQPLSFGMTESSAAKPSVLEDVVLRAATNKSVVMVLEVRDASGDLVVERRLGAVDAGTFEHVWDLRDGDGVMLAPGAYDVVLFATDESGEQAGTSTSVEVRALSGSRLPRLLGPGEEPTGGAGVLDAWAAIVAALLLGFTAGRVGAEIRGRRAATA